MRRSLDRAEARIEAHPEDMRGRYIQDNGVILDINEPGLWFTYERADPETLTWVMWHDLWDRGELVE